MASSVSTKGSQDAASGEGNEGVLGPESVPQEPEFEDANRDAGDIFGDKSPRRPPSAGSDLVMGLSECTSFEAEEPDTLGMDRSDATGKPDGPEKGKVDNGGAGGSLEWG